MTAITRRTLGFAAFVTVCAGAWWPSVRELVRLSLAGDTYSHILLIPFITIALIWMKRGGWKEWTRSNPRAAAALLLGGLIVYGVAWRVGDLVAGGGLALRILALLLLVWSGFLFFYGARAFRSAQFPLLFLLLTVPLPPAMIEAFIEWLRSGSAEVTHLLFRVSGTPVLRQGYVFVLPGVAIDIAPECSGIRSATAMLITGLLAGYLFLRSGWARSVLLLATVPMLVIKNGIRIVTLTLLAIHVDPGFLSGDLHQKGGVLFFLIGLLILWPVLVSLQAVESKYVKQNRTSPDAPAGSSSLKPSTVLSDR